MPTRVTGLINGLECGGGSWSKSLETLRKAATFMTPLQNSDTGTQGYNDVFPVKGYVDVFRQHHLNTETI